MSDPLVEKICQLIADSKGNNQGDSIRNEIVTLDTASLFIWLGEQDNSLRYNLALELDIPLQHLDHTCNTLKQIQHLQT